MKGAAVSCPDMKLIPYLRFAWAGQITVDLLASTTFHSALEHEGHLWNVFRALFVLTFAVYCVTIGIQEIKERQFIDGNYFYIFGTLYEILAFIGSIYVLSRLNGRDVEIWRIGIVMIWNITLLTIIYVDIRRMWTSKPCLNTLYTAWSCAQSIEAITDKIAGGSGTRTRPEPTTHYTVTVERNGRTNLK